MTLKLRGDIASELCCIAKDLKHWWTHRSDALNALERAKAPLYADEKIFGIGLSRTGTTSLSVALSDLGYRTAHWKTEGGRILRVEDLYRYDAAVDTPCAAMFKVLYDAFPGSKFVYTTRNIEEWAASAARHFGSADPDGAVARFEPAYGSVMEMRNCLQGRAIHQILYGGYNSWEAAYASHDEQVRDFFQDRDSGRLVEMNITGGDGWEVLCSFLKQKMPNTSFPHENRRDE